MLCLQVNVLYLLPGWLSSVTSHPLIKTHPDRSSLTLVVYGTPHVPFKYKRRARAAGFRDVLYGNVARLQSHQVIASPEVRGETVWVARWSRKLLVIHSDLWYRHAIVGGTRIL